MERGTLEPRKDTNYSNTFNKMIRSFPPSDSLSETRFFYTFPKENRLFFEEFDYKKNGTHFFVHPIGFLKQEGYFFQVTDLQFWKAVSPNDTLLSEIAFTKSLSNNFTDNVLTTITLQKNQINRIF